MYSRTELHTMKLKGERSSCLAAGSTNTAPSDHTPPARRDDISNS
jgi:hypothetical protein